MCPLPLDAAGIRAVQKLIDVLLYYTRAIESNILVALNTIGSQQNNTTEKISDAVKQLLHYVNVHPDATVRYNASEMMLHVHSNASYLSCSNARSRAGGYFFLSNSPKHILSQPSPTTSSSNGAIHTLSTIIYNILSSAAEAEVGALFHNAKDVESLGKILSSLCHP